MISITYVKLNQENPSNAYIFLKFKYFMYLEEERRYSKLEVSQRIISGESVCNYYDEASV
jgi:hypothetical protein